MMPETIDAMEEVSRLRGVITKRMLNEIFPFLIQAVRDELRKHYDVDNFFSDHFKFNGLCYSASQFMESALETWIEFYNEECNQNETIEVNIIHGEQRHTTNLESKYWTIEHTWVSVKVFGTLYYLDPTSSQFEKMYDDIPPYYIGLEPPKWFIADKDNWRYKKPWKLLDKIRIKHKDQYGVHNIHFTDYLVFVLWGRISDGIRKIIGGT